MSNTSAEQDQGRWDPSMFFYEIARCAAILPPKLPPSSWWAHIPFMYLLVRMLAPRLIVELGVQYGTSLIAACDAVKRENLDCRIVGVDTWAGDAHAGFYDGEAIYSELSHYLSLQFRNTQLTRASFDIAREQVVAGSIDLLHIDGLHTYQSVKHDFDTWRVTLSDRGVVLFHDTHEKERGFGVARFWDELRLTYPSFTFFHGHGLGVLFVGNALPAPLRKFISFVEADEGFAALFRSVYETMGNTLPERFWAAERSKEYDALMNYKNDNRREMSCLREKLASRDAELNRLDALIRSLEHSRAGPAGRVLARRPIRHR